MKFLVTFSDDTQLTLIENAAPQVHDALYRAIQKGLARNPVDLIWVHEGRRLVGIAKLHHSIREDEGVMIFFEILETYREDPTS